MTTVPLLKKFADLKMYSRFLKKGTIYTKMSESSGKGFLSFNEGNVLPCNTGQIYFHFDEMVQEVEIKIVNKS